MKNSLRRYGASGRRGAWEAALHHREPDRLLLAQHDERGAAVVVEPALDDLGDALPGDGERGKHARGVGGEVGEVLAVGSSIQSRSDFDGARFADGDRHSGSWKENGRGKSRGLRAIRPAVQAIQQSLTATAEWLPSRRRQRRQRRRRRQQQRPHRQRQRPHQQRSTGSGGSAAAAASASRSGLGSSSGIGSGIGRVVSSFLLLGATGTQHEGNRNGAPNLCIHRQLPQYVSENYKCTFAAGTAQFLALPCLVAFEDSSGNAFASKGRHFATLSSCD